MSNNFNNIYRNEIHNKLKVFVQKYYLRELFKGSIISISIIISLLIIFSVAEYFLRFNSSSRLFLLLSFSFILLFALTRFLVLPILKLSGVAKSISKQDASQIIGDYFPEIKDQLTNLLQLEKNQDITNALILASINQKAKKIAPFEFKEAISIKDVFKYAKWAIIPVFIVCIITIWNGNIIPNGANRIVNYDQKFTPENPFKFNILNETLTVIRYDNFTLQYKHASHGDSGQLKSTTDDGDNEGTTLCGVYALGNISAGVCSVETQFKESGVSVTNESSTMVYGLGYNLGGGVMIEAAYASIEQSQGATLDTNADVVITKISLGF